MAQERWTVLKALNWTTEYFRQKGMENPRLEAEVLLAHLLGLDRMGLYLNYDKPLKEEERKAYREMIQRRTAWEPIAYILGYKEFWSLKFKVNPECLIPRPETEHLVEEALRIGGQLPPPLRVLEIGTGCGAVAIVLAKELKEAQIVATDISPHALSLAQENARCHGVGERIKFVQGDLFPRGEAPFCLIVSNPPYIPTEEVFQLAPEVRDYEPLTALDGGEDGLRFFRKIAQEAPSYLVEGGWVLLEMGKGQASKVADILKEAGFTQIELIPDYSGIKRVARAQRG
ncbi:MAG: peptide chain release factor N(5)-glutamine methyltransferase [Deltaproteobacteria bacterium]|nr:MAG: peptide chain release factor N(5)-glutamine methyltransferase [Deltaproteobacteria bacterium]